MTDCSTRAQIDFLNTKWFLGFDYILAAEGNEFLYTLKRLLTTDESPAVLRCMTICSIGRSRMCRVNIWYIWVAKIPEAPPAIRYIYLS